MQTPHDLLIRKARLLDPVSGRDEVADLLVQDLRITRVGASLDAPGATLVEGEGLWLIPALVDLCAHLGSAMLRDESRAAAAGGVAYLAAQPERRAPHDTTAATRLIRERSIKAGAAHVVPVGALTQGLAGEQLAEMKTLADAGCVAFSNGAEPMRDSLVLKRALEYAATFDLTVMLRPQDPALAGNGCAHDGPVAARLGLTGIPAVAETVDIARILQLARATGARVHLQQVSTADGVALIRQARHTGLPVTADVAIHHLLLDEQVLTGFNSLYHVHPPLRSAADREALVAGVADGTLDAICSQHRPLPQAAKLAPFPSTEPGIAGVEALLSLTLELVARGQLPLMRALDAITRAPAQILGLPAGTLEPGRLASLALVATGSGPVMADRPLGADWQSSGHNSPWLTRLAHAQVQQTLCEGRVIFQRN